MIFRRTRRIIMKEKLIELLSAILVNIISSTTYDTSKKRVIEAYHENPFQEGLQNWINDFFPIMWK